jgi:porin
MNSMIKLRVLAAAMLSAVALGAVSVRAAELPTPNYSGEFLTRSTMTGDWGGVRNEWAKKGVTFDFSLTQVYQGVVSGGIKHDWEYGGRGDMYLNLDTGKAGLWPGGFLQVEGEFNYGQGVNLNTGALMPVNLNQVFPIPGQTDKFAVPSVTYTQFFSESFGMMFGKIQVMTSDDNAFAHGKGDIQFMNLGLSIQPLALFTAPYTPLGLAALYLPTKNPEDAVLKFAVFSSTGKANAAGWDTFRSDNLTFYVEGRTRTDFLDKTGHQLIGVIYSNRDDFKSIDQRLNLGSDTQLTATKSGSWAAFWNFDQFLYEPVKGSGKGFGIFGRLGFSDGNPNFMKTFYSLGVHGKGLIDSRPDDVFGLGWYGISINNPQLETPVGTLSFLRDEQGFEAYYNIALTPWAYLTPDIQVVRGAFKHAINPIDLTKAVDTSTTMGLRLRLIF